MVREYRILGRSRRVARGGRELTPPPGRDGGLPGRSSRVALNAGTDQERQITAKDGNVELDPGDVIRYELGGGGGYGEPWTRPAAEVLADVREGYVSVDGAGRDYGVAIQAAGSGWRLDEPATAALRRAPREG
jgi:N-methylhydantoinase B